ncbi:MAG: leucine-rich repeat domain-containing protein [Treponema sp.]|nr:leucine-rich repeat domain-containing protein [Treponema sp.]
MKKITTYVFTAILLYAVTAGSFARQGDFEISGGVLVRYLGNAAEVAVPYGVTVIGEWAFYGCESLEAITLPTSLTTIEAWAFSGCAGLKTVALPEGLTTIGRWAFSYCRSLKPVTLPASITAIGYRAFYNCGSLESITLLALKPPVLGGGMGAPAPRVIYVPAAALEAYRNAEGWKNYTNRIRAQTAGP